MKGKKINKSLSYLNDLPEVVTNFNAKCDATSPAYFDDVHNLVILLKRSALLGVANCLALFGNEKYKKYSNWEKFY